ncbi:uncharacterized protein LOC143078620 [Mytilus galloprovincialis]|uniref:uncharacterized protein LOC143078620 n=1 Tax=Mytilus galloprovincialis TaxID=29158 RepID=UPI003F7B6651
MTLWVKCAIRMRNSKQSTPGPYLYSPIFKAGFYPDSYSYTVNEGESINITFTSSVPVGCNGSNCDLNFYIRQWADTSSCINGIVNRDILIKAEFCGINLSNSTWMEKKTLQVYGYNDGLYNTNNRFADIHLYTSSNSKYHAIWEDVYIEPIRVHALFTSCGSGLVGASCLCGIAIRSKCSLFVLRTCEKISRREKHLLQQPVVSLTSCDKNEMTVIHTNDDYKIILPIATEIRFSIARRFISEISIKPSVEDINTAKGLCGVPSTTKDPSDDFTLRGKGQVTDEQKFADSWKITEEMNEEQLFVTEPDFLKTCNDSHDPIVTVDNNANNPNLGTFCACEQQRGSSQSSNGHCNLTQINEQCSESQSSSSAYVHYTRCSQSQRRRRAVDLSNRQILSDNDDFVDFQPLTYSNDVNDTHIEPPQTFRNGWTSERAYNICTHNISEALQKDMYKGYVDVPDAKFIEACVKDIEILQNDVLYTSGEDIVLATYRNSFMITLDIPASRKKRSTDNAVLSDGYDISLSYDGQNFGEEIRIIIYDDLQYSCNATTQTCITLIAEESSEKNETTKYTKDTKGK